MRYNNTICCTPILLITTPFAALNFTALNTLSKQPATKVREISRTSALSGA